MRIQFIQDLIDKLRNKAPSNGYINQVGEKLLTYEKVKDNIETVVFGSSHAQLGYRAGKTEFNLGLSFQDLYCSYNLYKNLNNPKIRNVILFYSVFSPGSQTIKSNFADKMTAFKIVTGIDYQDEESAQEKKLYKLEPSYKRQFIKFQKRFKIDENYRGNEVAYRTCFKPPTAKERADAHYKNNVRHNNQSEYVIKMQEISNENNANFFVVIPPATKSYKESLPLSCELFKELFLMAKEHNIKIIDMYDTDIFTDDDFEDWDHLNLKGANKITSLIKTQIENV